MKTEIRIHKIKNQYKWNEKTKQSQVQNRGGQDFIYLTLGKYVARNLVSF